MHNKKLGSTLPLIKKRFEKALRRICDIRVTVEVDYKIMLIMVKGYHDNDIKSRNKYTQHYCGCNRRRI